MGTKNILRTEMNRKGTNRDGTEYSEETQVSLSAGDLSFSPAMRQDLSDSQILIPARPTGFQAQEQSIDPSRLRRTPTLQSFLDREQKRTPPRRRRSVPKKVRKRLAKRKQERGGGTILDRLMHWLGDQLESFVDRLLFRTAKNDRQPQTKLEDTPSETPEEALLRELIEKRKQADLQRKRALEKSSREGAKSSA